MQKRKPFEPPSTPVGGLDPLLFQLSRRGWLWLALNACGIALYIRNAAALWPDPMTGVGDGFYWIVMVAPVLLFFFLTNLAVLVHILRTRKRAGTVRAAAWVFVAAAWIAAGVYDDQGAREGLHNCTTQFSSPSWRRAGRTELLDGSDGLYGGRQRLRAALARGHSTACGRFTRAFRVPSIGSTARTA